MGTFVTTKEINIGAQSNDGTGAPLRVAFRQVNENTDSLGAAVNMLGEEYCAISQMMSVASAPPVWQKSSLADKYLPSVFLPNSIVVRRPRVDYPEMVVYTPISKNGIDWARWLVTNRFNPGNTGSARVLACSAAKLYKSDVVSPFPSNLATASQSVPPAVQKKTSDASRSGSWSAPGTQGGFDDICYANTVGATSTYTVNGVNNISMRTFGVQNGGGVASIKIMKGGVEINDDYYQIPLDVDSGERRLDLRPSGGITIAGLNFVPIAIGLPTGDYSVQISYSSASPPSGRVYDGGIFAYVPFNPSIDGRLGTWADVTVGLASGAYAQARGARVVYAVKGSTISWHHALGPLSGIAEIKVYGADGLEISSDKYTIINNMLDCYAETASHINTTIADGLTPATYYVEIAVSTEKNTSSSGYKIYDFGCTGLDKGSAGIPGTDQFDDLGFPANPGTPSQLINLFLGGGGQLELAISASRPGETVSAADFCGGYHGHETAPTELTVLLDGVDVGFMSAAAGTQWVCGSVEMSFKTTLLYPSDDADAFASVDYGLSFDRSGYTSTVTREILNDTRVANDYTMMLIVPNTADGTRGAGGGFKQFWATPDPDVSHIYTAWDDGMYAINSQITTGLFSNDDYIVTGECLNTGEINAVYNDPQYSGAQALSFVQDRSDTFAKWYNRAFAGGDDNGVVVPAGNSYTAIKRYSVFSK
jgi:hypothetical protein